MKITCTVEEFSQLIRGCEKNSCYNCLLTRVGCGKGKRIEQFISAADVVASTEEKNEAINKHYRPAGWPGRGYQPTEPTEKPECLIPPVGSAGEDG